MVLNNANKELYLISSSLQDLKFSDETKNVADEIVMMEKLINYFLEKKVLTLDFIISNKSRLEKVEQFINMIKNIKVDNNKKKEIFSCIVNYLLSLNNFDIEIITSNKPLMCDVKLNDKLNLTEYRNKIYTDGSFQYEINEKYQHIKCNSNANYLMQVAIDDNNKILSKKSRIQIRDFNLELPSLDEIMKPGFPKARRSEDLAVEMNNIKDLEYRQEYLKADLEKYKILIKK